MSTSSSVNGFVAGIKTKDSSVPIAHLDYNFVSKCDNAKELEEIIKVLRSGSEGYYPDLVEYTENKLKEINPKSQVLRKDNPAQSYRDLDSESRRAVADDLQAWMQEMNNMDAKLKNSAGGSAMINGESLPPVRSMKTIPKQETDSASVTNASYKKSVKPRDYGEWDKFDIDKELKDIDKKEEKGNMNNVKKKKHFVAEPISAKELKSDERLQKAIKEKEKGNEAFKAQDYEEAVAYYTRSLEYEPTAASYNNRAAAELKLDKFSEAIEDCHRVLELDPNNIKAYLRRGMASKALKDFKSAVKDFNSMLTLDPNNKRAKELLSEIEKIERPQETAREEIASGEPDDSANKETKNETSKNATSKKKGQRIKIVEVDNSDDLVNNTVQPTAKKSVHEKYTSPIVEEGKGFGKVPKQENGVGRQAEGENPDKHNQTSNGSGYGNDIMKQNADHCNAPARNAGIGFQVTEGGLGLNDEVETTSDKESPALMSELDPGNRNYSDNVPVGNCSSERPSLGGEAAAKFEVENKSEINDEAPKKQHKVDQEKILCNDSVTNAEVNTKNTTLVKGQSTTVREQEQNTPTAAAAPKVVGKPGEVSARDEVKVRLELPANVKSLMDEGSKLYKMGRYAEALLKYSSCEQRLWKDRESYGSAMSGLLNNKAACYLKMGDCKRCVRECDKSLDLVSDNIKCLVRRGMAYETMEKYAEAFRDFNRVRLLDGSNKLAQEHCSRVNKHLEMLHGKSWRKKIFEMNSGANSCQKTCPGVERNEKITAVPHVHSSCNDRKTRSPEQTDRQPAASLQKTAPASTEPKCEVKVNHLEEFEKSKQEQYQKLKENGNALVKQGKHEEAVKHYTDCIKLCPKEVAVYTNRALCYLHLNKHKLAEADCSSALEIQKDNIKALFRRAKARRGLQRYRESSNDLVQILKLDTKNSFAKNELNEILQLLKKEKQGQQKPDVSKRKRIPIEDIEDTEDKLINGKDDQTTTSATKNNIPVRATKQEAKADKNGHSLNPDNMKISKAEETSLKNEPEEVSNASSKDTKLPLIGSDKCQQNTGKENIEDSVNGKVGNKENTPTIKHVPVEVSNISTKDSNLSSCGSHSGLQSTGKENIRDSANGKVAEEGNIPAIKHNVKTAYQFLQTWKSVKKGDTAGYLNILKQVNLVDLPKVMSSRLDADMMKSVFEALHFELKSKGNPKFVCQFLQRLHCVQRFEMMLLFLSTDEKEGLSKLFEDLEKQNNKQSGLSNEDLGNLRKKYSA